MIATANHIMVVVGPEVLEARAETAARLLAEHWETPVAVTPMAKGVIAETHPLFVGVYGGLGDRAILDLMEQSDLIVGFGVSSADFAHRWRHTAPVIHLTHSGSTDPGFPADIVLSGPLNALANQLQRQPARLENGEARARETRRAVRRGLLGRIDERALTPQEVVEQLRPLAPVDTPLAVEADLAGLLAAQLWTVTEPGRFLINNGLGLPGSGLALATVAALTHPRQGILWLGLDTALAVRPGFLSYLRELDANVVLIVINQGVRAELLRAQERAGYPPVASDYPPLNFEALAGTFGLNYSRVRSNAELRSALPEVLVAGRPVILEVIGDRDNWWRID
jgi:acetolactate synthase-1/2/3 large subunit